MKRILLILLGVGVVFAVVWQIFGKNARNMPDEVIINRESEKFDINEERDGLFGDTSQLGNVILEDEEADGEVVTEPEVEESGEYMDVIYTGLEYNNISAVVMSAVTGDLLELDDVQFFDESFLSGYEEFKASCPLTGVGSFDEAFTLDWENSTVNFKTDGVDYLFRYNINDAGLIDSIELVTG